MRQREESFTFWCLQSGRIPLPKYFDWARNYYGLAQLDKKYFTGAANMALWQQIHTVANWSPWMLPLEQWEGVVFIGCVEPPLETNWSFPVKYLLAEPAALEILWQKYHGTSDSMLGATTNVTQRSEGTNTLFNIQPQEPVSFQLAPESPIPAAREPMKFELAEEVTKSKIVAPAEPPEEVQAPLGLNLNIDLTTPPPPTPDAEPSLPPPLNLNLNLNLAPDAATPPALKNLKITTVTPTPPAMQPFETMAPAVAGRAAPVAAATNLKLSPAGALNINEAPDSIDAATSQNSCITWFFRQMRTRYTTGVVLTYSQNRLTTWKWEFSLKHTGAEPPAVSFDAPSLFRIVARTMRPYHGYPVDNPVHKQFFSAWGYSKMPAHVTAIPIMVSGAFKGIFLCISNDMNQGTDVLEFIEMAADRAVARLEKVDNPFATSTAA